VAGAASSGRIGVQQISYRPLRLNRSFPVGTNFRNIELPIATAVLVLKNSRGVGIRHDKMHATPHLRSLDEADILTGPSSKYQRFSSTEFTPE
jgi:hypothetical protein